jgi:cobalt transporter subunit CbtB
MNVKYGQASDAGQNAETIRRADSVLGAAMAAMLGVLIIGVVGFSHLEVAHNAAHDTRHSNGFPCH